MILATKAFFPTGEDVNARGASRRHIVRAVAWVASHPAVTAPLVGARTVEQLEGSLAALEIPMSPELRAEISALSPEPPPATDRSEERTEHGMLVR